MKYNGREKWELEWEDSMWVYFLYQVCGRTPCISEARFLISKVGISCFVIGSRLALYQLNCIASRHN